MERRTQSRDARTGVEDMLRHGDWLRRLARSLVRGEQEVEDVVQETWLAAARAGAPAGVESRSWLGGVLRNVALARARGEGRRRGRDEDAARAEAVASALDDAALLERQRALIDALARLPEAQRRALVARFYEDLPPRRIAANEGVPVTTVKSRIQRGLESLRRELDRSYGDRRSWSIVIAPMVHAPKSATGGWLAAAVLLVIGALATGVLRSALVGPSSTIPASPVDLAQLEDREAPPEAEALAGVPDDSAGGRSVIAEPAGRFRIDVVDRATGQPRANTIGALLLPGDAERAFAEQPPGFRLGEQLVERYGTAITTDENGTAWTDAEPPFFVRFADETSVGIGAAQEGAEDLRVAMVLAPPLVVQVVDGAGAPLDVTAPIQFEALVPRPSSSPGVLEESHWSTVDGVAENGRAVFRVVAGGPTAGDVVPLRSVRCAGFRVRVLGHDAPARGELEVSPDQPATVEVVMPPAGALTLQVLEHDGSKADVEGTASLEFADARSDGGLVAPIVDGVARWPAVVTGAVPVSIDVRVPALGARWRVDAFGPAKDGDDAIVAATLPDEPAVTVRLVDPSGRPVECESAGFLHGRIGSPRPSARIGAEPDAEGRVRFGIPTDSDLAPPFSIVAWVRDGRSYRDAATLLDLTADEVRAGVDLGEVVLDLTPPVTITGRVVDDVGTPLSNAWMAMTREGRFAIESPTDETGRFEIVAGTGEQETLTVRPDEPLRSEHVVTVRPRELDGPLEIVVPRGGALLASVDWTGFESYANGIGLRLRPADGGPSARMTARGGGSFESTGLQPGEYDVELQLNGARRSATVTGVLVAPTGDSTDARLSPLRLADVLRTVEVTLRGDDPRGRVRALVRDSRGVIVRHSKLYATLPLVVPTTVEGVLVLSVDGRRSVAVDLRDLGDSFDVDPAPGIPVTLRWTNGADARYFLTGEASALGEAIELDAIDAGEGRVELFAPAPGRYRLLRTEGSRRAPVSRSTVATIEVLDPEVVGEDAARAHNGALELDLGAEEQPR